MDVPNKISTHRNWDPTNGWHPVTAPWQNLVIHRFHGRFANVSPLQECLFESPLDGATGRSSFLWMLHNWSQNITDGTSGILTVSHTCSILSQWFQLLKRPHIRIIRNQPSSIFFKLDSWASTLQAFFSTCEHPQQQIFKTKCPFISPSWVAKRAVSFIMFDIFLHHRNTLARLCRPCASHQRYA